MTSAVGAAAAAPLSTSPPPREPARTTDQHQPGRDLELAELQRADRRVRAHEQAHAAVGGRYAGAPSFTYERGPNGVMYAVAGEVDIDTAPVPNDPEATIDKMHIVENAALAPIDPSPQDRRIAAEARQQRLQAEQEAAREQRALTSRRGLFLDTRA